MAESVAQSSIGIRPQDPVLRARDEQLEIAKAVVGKLSHDFNNFLAPQLGYVSLLKEDIPAGSSALHCAEMIEAAARKAESAIELVLLAVRPQRRFSPENFEFAAMLQRVLAAWTAELPPGHGIQMTMSAEPAIIFGDSRQWEAAFGHLLDNARFALASGGKLAIEFRPEKLSGEEMPRLGISQAEVLKLVVRDSGFGMSAEVARRVFEPFYTTRTHARRSGLGLTVVHSVARLHGGQVELAASPDEGAEITVWIAAPVLPRRGMDPASDSSSLARVLLLSEDPVMTEVLRTWLFELGCEAISVASENDLRGAFKWNGEGLSLLICDVSPEGSRLPSVLDAAGASAAPVPVLALTRGHLDGVPHSVELTQVQKPFTCRAFKDAIRRYLPRRS